MKKIAIVLAAMILAAGSVNAAEPQLNLSNIAGKATQMLTNGNGIEAGKALLGLYTQYKADGKFDIKNNKNISNMMILAANIKGLEKLKDVAPYVAGLSEGSKGLVNKTNQSDVLGTLTSLSNMDLSSLGSIAAGAAANSALTNLGASGKAKASEQDTNVVSQAGALLSGLFGKF